MGLRNAVVSRENGGLQVKRNVVKNSTQRSALGEIGNTWTPTLQHYSTYTTKEILPVVCKLSQNLLKREESKLKAVHAKYMNKKFMKVGELADLQGEIVQKLAKKQFTNL